MRPPTVDPAPNPDATKPNHACRRIGAHAAGPVACGDARRSVASIPKGRGIGPLLPLLLGLLPHAASAVDAPRGIGGLIGLDPAASLVTVTEGIDSDAIIVVVRAGTAQGTIGAGFATLPGSAGPVLDYRMRSGDVTFPSGDVNPRFIAVPIIDDSLAEGPETFTLGLSQPTGGAMLGPTTVVTVTILDDDPPPADPVFADGFEG